MKIEILEDVGIIVTARLKAPYVIYIGIHKALSEKNKI